MSLGDVKDGTRNEIIAEQFQALQRKYLDTQILRTEQKSED
jgi:hypothetical protein